MMAVRYSIGFSLAALIVRNIMIFLHPQRNRIKDLLVQSNIPEAEVYRWIVNKLEEQFNQTGVHLNPERLDNYARLVFKIHRMREIHPLETFEVNDIRGALQTYEKNLFGSGDSEKPYLVKEVETLYKAAFDKNSTGVVKYEELKNLTLLKYSEGQMQLLTSKPYPNVACHIDDILWRKTCLEVAIPKSRTL